VGDFVYVVFSPLFNLSDTCYSGGGCGHVEVAGSGVVLDTIEHQLLVMMVTQNYPAESDVEMSVLGVKAPAVGGLTGTYQIRTVTASGVDIDIDLDVEQLGTAPGLMQASLALDTTATGQQTAVLMHANLTSAFPAEDAWLELVLPDGASISPDAAAEVVSGLDGILSVSSSGNVVLLERMEAEQQVPAGGSLSLRLSGLVNPPRVGSFEYIVRTKKTIPSRSVSGVSTDAGLLVRVLDEVAVAVNVNPAPLQDTGVYPFPLSVGSRGPIRVRFRLANALPADGVVQLTFSQHLADLSYVLTSTFMAATIQEAQVTFVDGTACTSTDGSVVTVSRTSGTPVEAGVVVEVEVSIVQIFGFVNSVGHIDVSTMTARHVLIDSQRVPVYVSDSGVLTEADAFTSDCATQLTCSGSCGCSNTSDLVAGAVTDGPGPYAPDQECTWILASECGDFVFAFTSIDIESADDKVAVYECSSPDCSPENATLIDTVTGYRTSMPRYQPESGFLKLVFTSAGSPSYSDELSGLAEGFEGAWSSTYLDQRALGATTAAGTEARLHLSFWSANEVPAGGMLRSARHVSLPRQVSRVTRRLSCSKARRSVRAICST
jgi:hypothetical protein